MSGDERSKQTGEADAGAEVGDQLVIPEVATGQHDATGETGKAARDQHRADAVAPFGDTRSLRRLGIATEHPQAKPDNRAIQHHPHHDRQCQGEQHADRELVAEPGDPWDAGIGGQRLADLVAIGATCGRGEQQ